MVPRPAALVVRALQRREPREAAEAEDREPELFHPSHLHLCRHTFASLLIDSGANAKAIQEFMGHSKIQTTYDVYGHLSPEVMMRSGSAWMLTCWVPLRPLSWLARPRSGCLAGERTGEQPYGSAINFRVK